MFVTSSQFQFVNFKRLVGNKSFCSLAANRSTFLQGVNTQQAKKFQMDRHLYLVSPQYLELKYVNNPWMKMKQNFSLHRALDQHNALVMTYKKVLGAHCVSLIEPAPGLTELSFFGESVFALGKKALFGRLSCPERQKETDYVIDSMQELGFQGNSVPEDMCFEGSGETLMWRNKILIGYGQRNSKSVVEYVRDYFDKEVIGLELVDPLFYHLDIALFPVSDNLIAVCEEAFSEDSMKTLKKLDCEILTVSQEECKNFALNSVVFGNNVVVNSKAKSFIAELENRGYRVHAVDVSEFMKFGGGLKCLTLQHYL